MRLLTAAESSGFRSVRAASRGRAVIQCAASITAEKQETTVTRVPGVSASRKQFCSCERCRRALRGSDRCKRHVPHQLSQVKERRCLMPRVVFVQVNLVHLSGVIPRCAQKPLCAGEPGSALELALPDSQYIPSLLSQTSYCPSVPRAIAFQCVGIGVPSTERHFCLYPSAR
jgi:hypothetical protein